MNIIVSDHVEKEAIEYLRKNHVVAYEPEISMEGLKKKIADFDAIIVRSRTKVTKDIISSSNLKVIGRAGIGVDNIDVKEATSRKIPVVYAPGSSTQSVVELAIGLMVALARDFVHLNEETHSGNWLKGKVKGMELAGKTLGIYGLGRIGKEVGRVAMSIGMKVHAYDPFVKEAGDIVMYTDFHEFLKSLDILTIHAVLTDQTRHSIDEKEFAVMKEGIFIMNLSRGEIINENALVNALDSKKVRGVALDVYEKEPPTSSPLVKYKNVIMLPHIGAATVEAQYRAGMIVAQEVDKALTGKSILYCVNPEVLSK